MTGPFPLGSLAVPGYPWLFEIGRVVRGGRYRVIKSFADAGGTFHPLDEEWLYLGSMFDRDIGSFTLCVRSDSGEEWAIELACDRRRPGQADVIGNFLEYFAPIGPEGVASPVPRDQRVRYMSIFAMSPAAIRHARKLCAQNGVQYLRISAGHFGSEIKCTVQPERHLDTDRDLVNEFDGFSVVFHPVSMFALRAATVDWQHADGGGWLVIPPKKLDPSRFPWGVPRPP